MIGVLDKFCASMTCSSFLVLLRPPRRGASAFTGREVHKEVGMTGEITLRGRVLPVGGIREKVLAAHRAGLRTVIMPKRNAKDLIDVPKRARSELRIVLVEHIDQVLEVALNPAPVKADAPRRGGRKSPKKEEQVVEAQD